MTVYLSVWCKKKKNENSTIKNCVIHWIHFRRRISLSAAMTLGMSKIKCPVRSSFIEFFLHSLKNNLYVHLKKLLKKLLMFGNNLKLLEHSWLYFQIMRQFLTIVFIYIYITIGQFNSIDKVSSKPVNINMYHRN